MKKKSSQNLIRLGVVFGLLCTVIAMLELFDLHPRFSVGRFHSIWLGARHMDFTSGTMTIPTPSGEKVIQRDFDFGPVKIAIEA